MSPVQIRLECLKACGGVVSLADRAWRFVSEADTILAESARLTIVRETTLDEFTDAEASWRAALSFVEGADA